jgi:transposase-like protein
MATMIIRTTVAFDPATAARLERLALRWGVSKSETLRRALENAELAASPPSPASLAPSRREIADMTPQDALAWLQAHSLVSAEQGAQWRAQLQETREDFAARP